MQNDNEIVWSVYTMVSICSYKERNVVEWCVAIQSNQKAISFSKLLCDKFPYKSRAEWYCILTQIEYTRREKL